MWVVLLCDDLIVPSQFHEDNSVGNHDETVRVESVGSLHNDKGNS